MNFAPIASSSAGCAYLLTGVGAPLLIECGVSLDALQIATDFQVSSLAGCLISHSHGDHSKSALKLMQKGVMCFASPDTWKNLGLRSHNAFSMAPMELYGIGDWRFRGFSVVHDCPGTFGFLIGQGEENLLYLTDTAYSPKRFDGLTMIAAEANFDPEIMRENANRGTIDTSRFKRTVSTHMSLPRLIDMLKANDLSKVKEIWLLHLSDANSDEEAFKLAVQKATGVPVYVAPKGAR